MLYISLQLISFRLDFCLDDCGKVLAREGISSANENWEVRLCILVGDSLASEKRIRRHDGLQSQPQSAKSRYIVRRNLLYPQLSEASRYVPIASAPFRIIRVC